MNPLRASTVRLAGLAGLLSLGGIGTAAAADLNTLNALSQSEFRGLSEDFAAATSFKPMIPSEGLGITGFDLGVSVTGTSLKNREVAIKAAGGSNVPKTLPTAAVRFVKGLPLDIDIGASIGTVPGTNARTVGGEVRWAFIPGGIALPAVAVRLSGSQLTGVDQFKLKSYGVDLSLSKGFLFATPYVGIGTVQATAKAPGTTLANEKLSLTKVFGGVNLAFGPMSVLLETDHTGKATSYGAKFGIRF